MLGLKEFKKMCSLSKKIKDLQHLINSDSYEKISNENKDLYDLNSLLAQSIVMEYDDILTKLLHSNLRLVIQNLLIDPFQKKDKNTDCDYDW